MSVPNPVQPAWRPADVLPDMDDREFARWADLLEERTGMTMPAERKSFLVTSVGLRMREAGYDNYEDYFQYLTSGVFGNLEWTALVDRLTVHETRFFRDVKALEFLREEVLPGVLRPRPTNDALHIWSAGCSTGEEVYTLAMVVDSFLEQQGLALHYGITGTDISLHSLAVGKAGVYPMRRASTLPDDMAARYGETVAQTRFRVGDALRRRVCFAQMNILDAGQLASRELDVIYCQNLLIYFNKARREAIAGGLVHHLRPGGTLILGAGELVKWEHPETECVRNRWDVLAYRRRG
ncbi:MAG: hypothetical protein JJU06_06890 [Ectothiorhodospiraceae bacterium]|nr:hypothetical protein [Ectothiorhodospiraceae bacterium]MCH8502741.1 hypothetical protein [Ectothiorhodospiraceae bacterium]